MSLQVGSIIHGYCFGYFGRDHYSCARVEAFGADWVVARNIGFSADEGVAIAGTGSGILGECERATTPDVTDYHTCGIEGLRT